MHRAVKQRDADDQGSMSDSHARTPGAKQEISKPGMPRERVGMFVVLTFIAVVTIFVGAEEQQAEDNVWREDLQIATNGTDLPELKPMRYTTIDEMTWDQGAEACKQLGGGLCKEDRICTSTSGSMTHQLCPDQQCVGLEKEADLLRRVPVTAPTSSDGSRQWVQIIDCGITQSPQEAVVKGVLVCCGGGEDTSILAVHRAPVIQSAVISGNLGTVTEKQEAKEERGAEGGFWNFHQNMRENDPFLASKKQGSKMKSFHTHLSEKLQNTTVSAVTDHITDHLTTISSHVTNVIDSLKMSVNHTADQGSLQHHLRLTDPFVQKGKVAPIHHVVNEHLNSTSLAKHAATAMDTLLAGIGYMTASSSSSGGFESVEQAQAQLALEEESMEDSSTYKPSVSLSPPPPPPGR